MSLIYVYDFTLPAIFVTREQVEKWCIRKCKKWCFQRECGSEGYEHYQGRISLRKKTRLSTQIKEQPWESDELDNNSTHCHWSITSEHNRNNDFYCMKDNNDYWGVEGNPDKPPDCGPWTDLNAHESLAIPRQIREIEVLYPWQKSIINKCDIWDTRTINMIVDTTGNIGKSVLVGYMRVYGLARKIPVLNDYKDVMRMVMDQAVSRCYLIDMPRAMKKDKLGQLYTAIEEIKSGYAFDDRYSFKERFFDCPNMWIFTNTMPDFSLLSRDRWVLWEVNEQKELVRFNVGEA